MTSFGNRVLVDVGGTGVGGPCQQRREAQIRRGTVTVAAEPAALPRPAEERPRSSGGPGEDRLPQAGAGRRSESGCRRGRGRREPSSGWRAEFCVLGGQSAPALTLLLQGP